MVSSASCVPCRRLSASDLTAPASQAVLSNARLASRVPVSGGLALHNFEQTPPMSTYLVCLCHWEPNKCVCPGAWEDVLLIEARTVSIWATPHRWVATYRNKLARLEQHWKDSVLIRKRQHARPVISQSCADQHDIRCGRPPSAQAQGVKGT